MRTALLFSFLVVTPALAQTPTPPPSAPKPTTAAPAPQAPGTGTPAPKPPVTPRRTTPAPAARSGLAITVTTMTGATIPGVHVEANGPMMRMGDTDGGGQINFPMLQVGTYRLRFSGDTVTSFEKEVTIRSGQVEDVDVALAPAPPPREVRVNVPAPAAAAAVPTIGPNGSPQWGSLTDLAKKALATKPQPRELTLACSGNTRTSLQLLSEDQPQRLYADAESSYYVIDGSGTVTIGDRDGAVAPGSFVSVPRGAKFTITVNRRPNKPLVMLWVLSGERCENAR